MATLQHFELFEIESRRLARLLGSDRAQLWTSGTSNRGVPVGQTIVAEKP